jgi:N-carbamoyl-L-amino-acid hydrolase
LKKFFELSKFGKDLNGKGYRVAFTKGDVEGRKWLIDQMKKGLEVTIDFAGNIIGKRQGTDDSLKPIDLKSYRHGADGGDYDGCLVLFLDWK